MPGYRYVPLFWRFVPFIPAVFSPFLLTQALTVNIVQTSCEYYKWGKWVEEFIVLIHLHNVTDLNSQKKFWLKRKGRMFL